MYDYGYYDYGTGYSYGYQEAASSALAGFLIFGIVMWVVTIVISVFTLVCMWKVFKKAGKPGWAAIVPIYNIVVMLEIAELPMWYIALFFVPIANIYAMFKIYIELAHKFGKSTGFGIGLVFLSPIFLGILAFSKNSNYVGSQNVIQPQQTVYQQPVQPQQTVYQQPVQPQQTVYQQPVQPTVNQNQAPVFCTNCGNALMPNAKFCTKCGKQI